MWFASGIRKDTCAREVRRGATPARHRQALRSVSAWSESTPCATHRDVDRHRASAIGQRRRARRCSATARRSRSRAVPRTQGSRARRASALEALGIASASRKSDRRRGCAYSRATCARRSRRWRLRSAHAAACSASIPTARRCPSGGGLRDALDRRAPAGAEPPSAASRMSTGRVRRGSIRSCTPKASPRVGRRLRPFAICSSSSRRRASGSGAAAISRRKATATPPSTGSAPHLGRGPREDGAVRTEVCRRRDAVGLAHVHRDPGHASMRIARTIACTP